MKKIICLLMIVIMSMTSVVLPVAANDIQDSVSMQIFDKLTKLGIINGYDYNKVMLYEPVTRYQFLSALNNITTNTPVSLFEYDDSVVESAAGLGVLADKSNFRPNDTVLLEEAVKMSVVMLGYMNDAQRQGGYPFGHMSVATTLKLLSGVNAGAGEMLNLYDMLCLLDNVIDAPVLVQTTYGIREEYTARAKDTLLYLKRDIYVAEGIVNANEYTSLYAKTGVGAGRIMIGNNTYFNDDVSYNNLLGCAVEAYVREDEVKSDVVLYVGESKYNKTVKIIDEYEPSINADFTELSYYPENSTRKTTADIVAAPSVIKNGVLYDTYTAQDFDLTSGDLLLVDNNRDGIYDVVKITSYQLMVLNAAPGYGESVINIYTHSGALKMLDLGVYDSNKFVSIIMDGKEITLSELQKFDVLNVATSADGRVTNIYVTRSSLTGNIESIQDTDKIYVGNIEYQLSDGYMRALAANDSKAPEFKVGDKYILYLDLFGKIAAAQSISSGDYIYGYVIKGAYETGMDGKLQLRIFDENENWVTMIVPDKLKVNNERKTSQELYAMLFNNGIIKPQLLAYKTSDGVNFSEILVAEVGAEGDSGKYMRLDECSGTYRQTNSSIDWQCFIKDNALIWVVPKDITNEEGYYIDTKLNVFVNGNNYTVTPYNIDEYNTSDKLVWKSTKEASTGNVFLVEKVGVGFDENGYEVAQLTGVTPGYPRFTIQTSTDGLFNGLKKGDAITFVANGGKVVDKTLLYSYSGGKRPFLTPTQSASNKWHNSIVGGTITAVDLDYPIIKISSTESKNVVLNPSVTNVLIYNTANDTASVGDLSDITIGDYAVFNILYSMPRAIIIYR